MYDEASLARNSAGPTISSGSAVRFSSVCAPMASAAPGADVAYHIGVDRTGGQRVHTDAVLGEFPGEGSGDRQQGRLHRRIHRDPSGKLERAHRDHVDYRTAAAGAEMGDRGADEQSRSAQVHLEGLLPHPGGLAADRRRQCIGRVVDDDVEPAESIHRRTDDGLGTVGVAHVDSDAEGISPYRLEVILGLLAGILLAAWRRPRSLPPPRSLPQQLARYHACRR